jgi:hypothetical protein
MNTGATTAKIRKIRNDPRVFDPRVIGRIAKSISTDAFPHYRASNITTFLVGARSDKKSSIRQSIRDALSMQRPYRRRLDVYYPEDLFEEVLRRSSSNNLLTLENHLAESVHCVVVILEKDSPGAIAELGAFANHTELSKRLVVVVDERHKRDKSFIMLGPIRYLRQKVNKDRVIYHNLRSADIDTLAENIGRVVRSISQEVSVDDSPRNPILTPQFVRLAMYILCRVTKRDLETLITVVTGKDDADILVATAIAVLSKQQDITKNKNVYTLTEAAVERFRTSVMEKKKSGLQQIIDKNRLIVINAMYRKCSSHDEPLEPLWG